jgi:hypothetical protein
MVQYEVFRVLLWAVRTISEQHAKNQGRRINLDGGASMTVDVTAFRKCRIQADVQALEGGALPGLAGFALAWRRLLCGHGSFLLLLHGSVSFG